jgi:peptidyl-prolyl cis-trans isomerase SurA
LEERLNLLLFFTNTPDTPENRQEILASVLSTLIEERLQLAEIKNAKLTIDDDQLQAAFDLFEQQNSIPSGGLIPLLEQNHLSRKTLEDQAKAQIGWIQLMRNSFQSQLRISDREVEKLLKETQNTLNNTYYLLGEIFLNTDNYPSPEQLQKHAEQIFMQLAQGAPFTMLAHHFSQSASAATYGDIGWIREDHLNNEVAEVLSKTSPGNITPPIHTSSGCYILAVRAIRHNTDQGENQQLITLKQVRFPFSVNGQGQEKGFMKKLQNRVKGCHNLEEIAPLIPGCKVRDLEKIPTDSLPELIKNLLKDLPEGQLSEAIVDNNNLLAYMPCHTETRTAEETLKEQLRQQLEAEKISQISTRILRDLKNSAYISSRV